MSAAVVPMPQLPRHKGLHLVAGAGTQPAAARIVAQTLDQVLPRIQACAAASLAPVDVEAPKRPHALRLVAASVPVPRATPVTVRVLQTEIAFYRKYTEGMLRRYLTMSMEKGRVPALLGRELFRGRVSNYKVAAFDDVVIFVHDIDGCLNALDPVSRYLLNRITIEGYTQQETAALAGLGLRTVIRKYGLALDKMTRLLLDRGILEPVLACEDGLR